jgi:hypothetical protein
LLIRQGNWQTTGRSSRDLLRELETALYLASRLRDAFHGGQMRQLPLIEQAMGRQTLLASWMPRLPLGRAAGVPVPSLSALTRLRPDVSSTRLRPRQGHRRSWTSGHPAS